MTRRDLRWRLAGVVLLGVGGLLAGSAQLGLPDSGAALTLFGVLLALCGLLLAAQGKRVPLALQIERSPHRALPGSIHQRRIKRLPR